MRQTLRALTVAALTLPATVAGSMITGGSPALAIAHGQDAPDGRYGFAVKLTMTGLPEADGGLRDSSCTGSLVAPQWIITAGHCFKNAKGTRVAHPVAGKTVATVGRTDLDTVSVGHDATVIAVRQSSTTDVALARIDTPITDITPIRLSRTGPDVGDILRLAGYGFTTDTDASSLATRLQTGQFEVVSLARSYIGVTGRAPSADTSPCSHDSGGPYFRQQGTEPAVLVAVVSNGPDCPHDEVDLSGRIDTIADWITDIIGPQTVSKPSPSRRPTTAVPTATSRPLAAPAPGRTSAPVSLTGVTLLGAGATAALLVGSTALAGRRRRRAYRTRRIRRHRA